MSTLESVKYGEERKLGIAFPSISVLAFWAASSESKDTNPNPFDLSETLSIMILAGKRNYVKHHLMIIYYNSFEKVGSLLLNEWPKIPSTTCPYCEKCSNKPFSVV